MIENGFRETVFPDRELLLLLLLWWGRAFNDTRNLSYANVIWKSCNCYCYCCACRQLWCINWLFLSSCSSSVINSCLFINVIMGAESVFLLLYDGFLIHICSSQTNPRMIDVFIWEHKNAMYLTRVLPPYFTLQMRSWSAAGLNISLCENVVDLFLHIRCLWIQ